MNSVGFSSGPRTVSSSNPAHTSFFTLVKDYILRILPRDLLMKVLLVDDSALPMISTSFSQSELLERGVFLVESLNSAARQRNLMKTMRCVIVLRPEQGSVDAACAELRMAKYRNYHIVFCGATNAAFLDALAKADTDSLVEQVEEIFCDFCAVNADAFIVQSPPPRALVSGSVSNAHIRRAAEGLASMMVAQRRRPLIRYQQNSMYAKRVATELVALLKSDPVLYDYRARSSTLLILDRSDDPMTALLTPWTYQAMLDEHIGLRQNTLKLPDSVEGADKEGYVFSQQDDTFFAKNMYNNWGDLCSNVKTYVDQCKAALHIDKSTATLEELKRFMQQIPQTKSLTGSVTKHTMVTTYLSQLIKARNLLEISLLEQDMVASANQSDHWGRLQSLAARSDVRMVDLTRLCLIYHLRYEQAGQHSQVTPLLDRVSSTHAGLLKKLRNYYGSKPTERLFAATGVMAAIVKTFVDVGNIYTQHEPVLKSTLQQLFSGQLSVADYPVMAQPATSNTGNGEGYGDGAGLRPTDAMVYMCGGYTYEEAALVHAVNAHTAYKPADTAAFAEGGAMIRASIGGDDTINSATFLKMLGEIPNA